MFCLVLPGLTLMAGFPGLRCLSKTTLAFRPPQTTDLAVGGSNPSRRATNTAAQRPCAGSLTALRPSDCDQTATTLAGTPRRSATTCDHNRRCRRRADSHLRSEQIAQDGMGPVPALSIAAGLAVGVVFVAHQRRLVDPYRHWTVPDHRRSTPRWRQTSWPRRRGRLLPVRRPAPAAGGALLHLAITAVAVFHQSP
jgi:hypothetical protein